MICTNLATQSSSRYAQLAPRRLPALLKLLALVALGGQDDVVLELEDGLVVALERLEVDNQVVLDGKDGVRLQPGVVFGIQLRRAALEFGVGNLLLTVSKSRSKICSGSPRAGVQLVSNGLLTMIWMWAGRMGWRSSRLSSL